MHDRHADLRLVGLAGVVSALVVVTGPELGPLTIIAGLALTLALPGYALTVALFRPRLAHPAQYVALSLGLSLSVTILGGLLLNAAWPSARPVTRDSWAVLLCVVTVVAGAYAAWRDHDRPVAPRRAPRRRPRPRDIFVLWLAIVVMGGAITLARAPQAAPRGVTGYTELWLVPHAPMAQLGLRSDELHATRYVLQLRIDGQTVRTWRLRLEPGARATVDLPIDKPLGGHRRVGDALLYRATDLTKPYRRVRVNLGTATERNR